MATRTFPDSDQKLNPPQSPLVRGEAEFTHLTIELEGRQNAVAPSSGGGLESKEDAIAPPLTRGGREGLNFLPYNPRLTELARANRKNPTVAERKVWHEVLCQRQFANYKFLRQKPIDEFIVDFYCSSLKLVIEIDGDSHAEAVEYDAARTRILNSHGLRLVRYTNNDVIHNISGVYDDLMRHVAAMNRATDTK